MEVEVAALAECFVSPGWRLNFAAARLPAIHSTLNGSGRMRAAGQPPFILRPHTLVVMPPDRSFYIEGGDLDDARRHSKLKEVNVLAFNLDDDIQTFRAGDDDPKVSVICGYFRASYGLSINLFSTLRQPIVEHFDTFDHLAHNLQTVLAEINDRQVGMRAMTAAVLKQVFVTLLRRSLMSAETWTERFALLSDPQTARASTTW
jgi:Cupin